MTSTNRGMPTTTYTFTIVYKDYASFLAVDLTHVTMVRPFLDTDNTFICSTDWEGFIQTMQEVSYAMHLLGQVRAYTATIDASMEV